MTDMEIDEHLLKVKGDAVALIGPMSLGEDVQVMVEGSVVKIEDSDNNDGTMTRTYHVKGMVSTKMQA